MITKSRKRKKRLKILKRDVYTTLSQYTQLAFRGCIVYFGVAIKSMECFVLPCDAQLLQCQLSYKQAEQTNGLQ